MFPTDTLYGFTADARHHGAVERILDLKERRTPLSCIPPTKSWASQLVAMESRELYEQNIDRYFGSYTSLWPASREQSLLHPLVQTQELIGLRFPNHWVRQFSERTGIPLTTTSVNISGNAPMHSLASLDQSLIPQIDFLLDEGALEHRASTLVRCDTPEFLELQR